VWWHTPVILALRRLWQEDHEFDTSLGHIVRYCFKTKKGKRGRKRLEEEE
jgi:hypothetical protein